MPFTAAGFARFPSYLYLFIIYMCEMCTRNYDILLIDINQNTHSLQSLCSDYYLCREVLQSVVCVG